jgi:3-phenylpropionate/cinnamic acid dioxygenase small subunit
MSTPVTDAAQLRSIERFVYREAQYADEHRFEEWHALWAEGEVHYLVPSNDDDADTRHAISIINDNRAGLAERIIRLKGRAAYSQRPRSRMRRLLSNLEIDGGPDGEVVVLANFAIIELRAGHQDVFGGRVRYRLVPDGENGWRLRAKTVWLINNDDYIDNISFLL